jgi:HAD superfamily hydrolase (TIGR01458 family)
VSRIEGCIVDLDGTVYVGPSAVPGVADALETIRSAGVQLRFATNTTRHPRSALVRRLADLGVRVASDEVFTAPLAAATFLADRGARRVSLLLAEATFEEFVAFELDHERPDWVVVGDLGEEWTYGVLNRAFRGLRRGAELLAIQKNRAWDDGQGLRLDAGPFVAALEYATGQEAILVGKPSSPFFLSAAASMGLDPERVLVIGDGLENDVGGGHAAGCLGVAVRTGSFQADHLDRLDLPPDGILDSLADLPAWLGL